MSEQARLATSSIISQSSLPTEPVPQNQRSRPIKLRLTRLTRAMPPHPPSSALPRKSSNDPQKPDYAHPLCCLGENPDDVGVQPCSSRAGKTQAGNKQGTLRADLSESWSPIRNDKFGQKNPLRVEHGMETLLQQTSGVGSNLAGGEEWTKLDEEDGNEDWVAISSEKRNVDDWVDLGLKGEGGQYPTREE